MAQLHSGLTANHRPYAAIYADAAARLAATGFVRALGGGTVAFAADDLYKKVLQLDDGSEWILTAVTPTWVQVSGAGSIANDSVTNAKLANMAQSTIKGRAAGAGTGDPTDLTATQATAILNAVVGDSGSGGTRGLVPAPGAGDSAAGKFLKADGTFAVPATGGSGGIGDVVGPSSATDNALARFDTTTGKLLQNSVVTADDNGAVTVPEIAAPSTPASGKVVFYAKADGKLYSKNDAGSETALSGGSGPAINATDEYLPKRTSSTTLGDSLIREVGGEVQIFSGSLQNMQLNKVWSGGTGHDDFSVARFGGLLLGGNLVMGWFSAGAYFTNANKHPGQIRVVSTNGGGGGTFAFPAQTQAQITSNQNDYSVSSESYFIRLSSDAPRDITGLRVPADGFGNRQVDGEFHLIVNIGSTDIVLKNENASSTAANRFTNSTGADITLSAKQAADIIYDGTTTRWLVFKRN